MTADPHRSADRAPSEPPDRVDLIVGVVAVGLRLGDRAVRVAVAPVSTVVRVPALEDALRRALARIADEGRRARRELERSLIGVVDSRITLELTTRVLDSASMQHAIEHVVASTELRRAMAEESAGIADRTLEGVRRRSALLDDRAESRAREWLRRTRPQVS